MFVLWVFISDWYCLGIKTALMPVLCAKTIQKVLYITVHQPSMLQAHDIVTFYKFLCRCNILEEPIESAVEYADYIPLELKPFEVTSFIFYLKRNT